MSTTVLESKTKPKSEGRERPELVPGLWTKEINLRNFILNNYTPYYGDGSFLAGPTKRTTAIWKKLTSNAHSVPLPPTPSSWSPPKS